MTQLKILNLRHTQITDAGLVHLEGMASLETLYLNGTQVSKAGVKQLRTALPDCAISH